jgi:hypothetical protein
LLTVGSASRVSAAISAALIQRSGSRAIRTMMTVP